MDNHYPSHYLLRLRQRCLRLRQRQRLWLRLQLISARGSFGSPFLLVFTYDNLNFAVIFIHGNVIIHKL